jgi:vacuolar protein sorting-associated protein 35
MYCVGLEIGDYHLFLLMIAYRCFSDTQMVDDMKKLEESIVEEHKSGRSIRELYELVQYAGCIIPRTYLMIIVGMAFVRAGLIPMNEILYDLTEMLRGVQNPLRGLFARYYLLQATRSEISNR